LAEKRLEIAERDKTIQGYEDGVFWERNTLALQKKNSSENSVKKTNEKVLEQQNLF
jgi:site-specific DNA-methyltransferase (adenine-specific)